MRNSSISSILCRPQSEAAQHDFEGEARGDVAQERVTRLAADVHRGHDLIDGPVLGLAGELGRAIGVDQETARRAGLRHEQISTEEPVGVDQGFGLLALEPVGAAEQRIDALRLDLGEDLQRLCTGGGGAGVIRPADAGPMNAYAWATRSLASARRSRSTARGWSRMRSSATEEVLDDRPHLGLDDGRRTRRADQPHALRLGATDLEIAPAHPAVKGERFALEAVETPAADPPQSLGGIEVEEQREVGHDAPGRARVQLADQVGIDAATVPLIGDSRIGVPIAEDDATPVEPRPDLLRDVLLARGHEEEDLDERLRMHTRALEQATHFDSEPRAVGLARVLDLPTLLTKPSLEPHHLGRLARPFDALEGNQ